MHEYNASAIVPAPVEDVYVLFAHFHRYPAVLRHVRDVTFYDDQLCRWRVDLGAPYEFDAVADNWRRNSRIGWRETTGRSAGEVAFAALGKRATRVFVSVRYDAQHAPGLGLRGDHAMAQDLDLFAAAVGNLVGGEGILDWNAIVDELATLEKRDPRPVPRLCVERGTLDADQRIRR